MYEHREKIVDVTQDDRVSFLMSFVPTEGRKPGAGSFFFALPALYLLHPLLYSNYSDTHPSFTRSCARHAHGTPHVDSLLFDTLRHHLADRTLTLLGPNRPRHL
jgi:hypothetical protein